MLAIRRHQEERDAWDEEKSKLEEECRQKDAEIEELAGKREQLAGEVEQLRGALEAAEGLARTDAELETSRRVSDGAVAGNDVEALRRLVAQQRREVAELEAENVQIRTAFNDEKQRVIDLKNAARNRKAAWQEELAKITEELNEKETLQNEVTELRTASARARKELELAQDRDARAQCQIQMLRRELQEAREAQQGAKDESTLSASQEMEVLSATLGRQIVEVEEELQRKVQQSSQLLEQFLHHSRRPLETLRSACQDIALSGDAGSELCGRAAPPLFEERTHEHTEGLVKVVNLLRFASDVLEARERLREQRKQQQLLYVQERQRMQADDLQKQPYLPSYYRMPSPTA